MASKNKFRFRRFPVHIKAREFRRELRALSQRSFPKEEQYCLTSQLWRSLDSIILNIAEGADRGTDKDFAHFLNNAHTSLNEVVGCLDLALDDRYFSVEQHAKLLRGAEEVANQLTAFRNSLLKSPTK